MDAVRFRLSVGARTYLFTDRGRLFLDGRFVKPDEASALVALERSFSAMFARSPYAKCVRLRDKAAGPAFDGPSGRVFVPTFHGFEDARYQRLDAAIVRAAESVSAPGRTIPPSLLKSLLVETRCWDFDSPSLDDAHVEAVAAELAAAAKGAFSGWGGALMDVAGRRIGANAGRRYCVDFAARVEARANNPDEFVPALGRRSATGGSPRQGPMANQKSQTTRH